MPDTPRPTYKPRACETCARAKSKCVWTDERRNGLDICVRCLKNDLVCTTTQPGPRKKRAKSTRVNVIEKRVNSIVSLLERNRHILGPLTEEIGLPQIAGSSISQEPPPSTTGPSGSENGFALTTLHRTSALDYTECIEILPGYNVSYEEADGALQEYVTDFLQYFPFVPLPVCNVRELLGEKPILLKTIVMVVCRPSQEQILSSFESWFRQHTSHQIVVLGEKRLETLQAILIFYAWADFRNVIDVRNTSLLQLMAGLVSDLGLNKSPRDSEYPFKSLIDDTSTKSELKNKLPHTNSERRIILGLFYISSILSSLFNKPLYQQYNSYLDECCRALLHDKEFVHDTLLVQLVRIQQLATRMNATFSEAGDGMIAAQNYHTVSLSVLQKELDSWSEQLPEELKSNYILRSHHSVALVRLYEPPIHILPSDWADSSLVRAQCIWNCFQHAIGLFQSFFSAPTQAISQSPFIFIAHLTFAIIKITRLLTFKDPDWDPDAASTTFKFEDRLEMLSTHFEARSRDSNTTRRVLVDGKDKLLLFAEKMRWFRSWYLSNRSGMMETDPMNGNLDSTDIAIQFEDSEFWESLLNFGPTE